MANGGTFFIYGTGGKQGFCFQENTKSAQGPEWRETDSYNFYSVDAFQLIKRGAECISSDQSMGIQSSLHACATVVMANGGTFFIYGTGGKQGWCYQGPQRHWRLSVCVMAHNTLKREARDGSQYPEA